MLQHLIYIYTYMYVITPHVYTYMSFGLCYRLWLRPNPSRSATPKRLGLKNVLPAQRDVLIPARYHGFGGMMSMQTMNTAGETISTGVIGRKYQTFDGLSKTVEKMNADLQANPLPGRYFSKTLHIQTDRHKVSPLRQTFQIIINICTISLKGFKMQFLNQLSMVSCFLCSMQN